MASQPRYPRPLYDGQDPLPGYRDDDARLDDRTGVGPGTPGGYRASREPRRDPRPDDRYREDPRYAEARSFDPPQSYTPEFRGRPRRPEHEITPEDYRRRRQIYRGADFSGETYRPERAADNEYWWALAESRYGGVDPMSPYNPYGSWWGIGPNFGFGQDLRGEPAAELGGEPHGPEQHGRHFWDKASDEVASWLGDEAAHSRRQADRGEHAGRGPKGYKRSDGRIQEDVSDHLTNDSWLDASRIEVQVREGEVTLNGKVASRDDKRRAELWAETVSGVSHVQNNLRVDRNVGQDGELGENSVLDDQAKGNA